MNQGSEPIAGASQAPIIAAIADGELLLAYAASHGINLPVELVAEIVAAKSLPSLNLDSPDTFDKQVKFWEARNQLATIILPVTSASIKASAQTGPGIFRRSVFNFFARNEKSVISPAERCILLFRTLALIALCSLLVVQVYWVVGSKVISETETILTQAIENQKELIGLDAGTSKATLLETKKMGLEAEIRIRYAVLESWNNIWISPLRIFGFDEYKHVEKPSYADLQQARLAGKFACQSIELYLLPLLYGWLGACLYVLRRLAQDIGTKSFTPEQGLVYSLRVYMGTLAGLIVVWFLPVAQTDPNIKSLSVFAVALLVGYSIDLLFALMDRIISAFTAQK
ncbi:hypothetical protein [Uliginosibacterium gangwonense]|uniref:hypothetical protein n=1 Tax=Uliginosibacterium gangwonense TaxID=392736 RepID=UPI0003719193|nr:hypothetical protein [Uliginosibacterium gangwonense]